MVGYSTFSLVLVFSLAQLSPLHLGRNGWISHPSSERSGLSGCRLEGTEMILPIYPGYRNDRKMVWANPLLGWPMAKVSGSR